MSMVTVEVDFFHWPEALAHDACLLKLCGFRCFAAEVVSGSESEGFNRFQMFT
jgi:hypothetical protein